MFIRANAQLFDSNVLALSNNQGCAVTDQGLRCWGSSMAARQVPSNLKNVRQIGISDNMSCAIDDTGLNCWGGIQENREGAKQIKPFVPTGFKNPKLVNGHGEIMCVVDDEGLKCWKPFPDERSQQIKLIVSDRHDFKSISSASNTVCGILPEKLACFDIADDTYYRRKVTEMGIPSSALQSIGVSADGLRVFYIDNGNVYEVNTRDFTKLQTAQLPLTGAISLSVGVIDACALTDFGVRCWSYNAGELGDDFKELKISAHLVNPRAIAVGYQMCALDESGIQCWPHLYSREEHEYNRDDHSYLMNTPIILQKPEQMTAGLEGIYILDQHKLYSADPLTHFREDVSGQGPYLVTHLGYVSRLIEGGLYLSVEIGGKIYRDSNGSKEKDLLPGDPCPFTDVACQARNMRLETSWSSVPDSIRFSESDGNSGCWKFGSSEWICDADTGEGKKVLNSERISEMEFYGRWLIGIEGHDLKLMQLPKETRGETNFELQKAEKGHSKLRNLVVGGNNICVVDGNEIKCIDLCATETKDNNYDSTCHRGALQAVGRVDGEISGIAAAAEGVCALSNQDVFCWTFKGTKLPLSVPVHGVEIMVAGLYGIYVLDHEGVKEVTRVGVMPQFWYHTSLDQVKARFDPYFLTLLGSKLRSFATIAYAGPRAVIKAGMKAVSLSPVVGTVSDSEPFSETMKDRLFVANALNPIVLQQTDAYAIENLIPTYSAKLNQLNQQNHFASLLDFGASPKRLNDSLLLTSAAIKALFDAAIDAEQKAALSKLLELNGTAQASPSSESVKALIAEDHKVRPLLADFVNNSDIAGVLSVLDHLNAYMEHFY